MKHLYVKINKDYLRNRDFFLEDKKGNARLKINLTLERSVLDHTLPIFNTSYLRDFVSCLFQGTLVFRIYEEEEAPSDYVFLMKMDELLEIARVEMEYHIIKHKFPVWIMGDEDGEDQFVKVIVVNPEMLTNREKIFKPTLRFPDFRKAEAAIKDGGFKSVKRIPVVGSPFEEDDNILVVYKVK